MFLTIATLCFLLLVWALVTVVAIKQARDARKKYQQDLNLRKRRMLGRKILTVLPGGKGK